MFKISLDNEDLNKYITTNISGTEIRTAYDLITREVNCKAAFQNICNFLKLSDVEIKGYGISSFVESWFKNNILPNFKKILMWFYICGFCPYTIDHVWVDTSKDEEWLKEFKKSYDETKQPYMVKRPIIIIPEYDSFVSKLLTNRKTLQSHIVCENVENPLPKMQKLKVIISKGYFNLPRKTDGLLQSPLASLIYSYEEMRKYKAWAMQASYTLAHPVTFVQNGDTDKNDNIVKTTNKILFSEAVLFPNRPGLENLKYEIMSERERAQFMETKMYQKNTDELLTLNQNYFQSSISNSAEKQRFINPTELVYPIKDGLQISKSNPTPAKVPEEITQIRDGWSLEVAKAFAIPHMVISNVKKSGGGSNKNYSDMELKELNSTINHLTAEMKHVFEILQTELKMGTGDKKMEFVIHPQPFYDPDFLLSLWENRLLTEWQMGTMLQDAFGIPADPVKKLNHSTADFDMVLGMKKEEAITGGQAKKQLRLLHNADI